MHKATVAILLDSPFNKQNYYRIGTHQLKNTFRTIVFDCTKWLAPNIERLDYQRVKYPHVEEICDENDFISSIEKHKPDFAINYLGNLEHRRFILRTLRQHGVKSGVQRLAPVVDFPLKKRIIITLIRNPAKLFDTALNRFQQKNPAEKENEKPDFALIAGSKYLDSFTAQASTIIEAASQDYFIYRCCKGRKFKRNFNSGKPYNLFIDDCIADTNDYFLFGKENPLNPQEYYRMLNDVFDKIERITDRNILIAGHPNGEDKQNYKENFGGRAVFFGLTAQLAERCELALTHYSTAIAFPVLWLKPIILLTLGSVNSKMDINYWINCIAYYLKCRKLPLGSRRAKVEKTVSSSRRINADAYNTYIHMFIKNAQVMEKGFYHNFIEYIKAVQ